MAKREHKSRQKENDPRGTLFQAGVDLFSEKGYEATSVREIVDRAGVTKPVLYYYFGSKEGLLHSILDHASSMHKEALERALDFDGHIMERLEHLYEMVSIEARKNRNLGKMISSMIFAPVPLIPQEQIRKFIRNTGTAVKQIYMEGVAKEEITAAEAGTVTFLLMSLLDYSLMFDFVDTDTLPPGDFVKMLKLVYNGLQPRGN